MSKRKKNRTPSPKKKASANTVSRTAAASTSETPETATASSEKTARPAKATKTKTRNSKTGGFLMDRRKLLLLGLSVPAVGIGGVMIHRYDVQQKTEHDLSVIGQGAPVVVQIHDPGCSMCRRLMRNAREALPLTPEIVYRVANIKTPEGADFQRRHSVPHVTLLLFNGEGKLQNTLQGITPTEDLKVAFRELVDRTAAVKQS